MVAKESLKGGYVLFPRIQIILAYITFQFLRLQFSIQLEFAITINKAKDQSLDLCGLDLGKDFLSYEQLYVAIYNLLHKQ